MSLLNEIPPAEFTAPDSVPTGSARARLYWRSLDELAQTPQFQEMLHREFPKGASEMDTAFSRRSFLSLMAASVALAGGLSGCRRPEYHALPYAQAPEHLVEGMPQFYASSLERSGYATGILVKSFNGRPIKIEGNPDHPVSGGSSDPITQALILEMYDPDRSRTPLKQGELATRAEAEAALTGMIAAARATGGAGVRFLAPLCTGPSLLAARDRLLAQLPQARWHVWEPVNDDRAIEGARLALGRPLRLEADYAAADVIISLDSECLVDPAEFLRPARQFYRRRRPEAEGGMNRLYAIEGNYTLTGANADHRLPVASSRIPAFALALAQALAATPGGASLGSAVPAGFTHNFNAGWLSALAADCQAHAGRVLVVAGRHQPPAVHAVAHAINAALGAQCARYRELPDATFAGCWNSIAELADAIKAGQVTTLVMLGGNPAYDAPAGLQFDELLAKVPNTVHLSLYVDETSSHCAWHIPMAHPLESWGDTRALDGTIGLTQPLIAPLYDGLTPAELLAIAAGDPVRRGYEIVRAHTRGATPDDAFDPVFRRALHAGLIEGSAAPAAATPAVDAGALAQAAAAVAANAAQPAGLELLLVPHPLVYDGRHANNGWLQEIPDTMTKLSWDNAAVMGPATALKLGVQNEDVVALKTAAGLVELPAWIVPGIAEGQVIGHLGYGRAQAGHVGNKVGINLYPLRHTAASDIITGVEVTRAGRRYELATTQGHWSMEGRDLIREHTLAEFLNPAPAAHAGAEAHGTAEHDASGGKADQGHAEGIREEKEPDARLWKEPNKETGEQWGMAIDLTTCIGCNACVVACQSENNIPIVGKDQVIRSREMQWIRVDRYFISDTAAHADPAQDPNPQVGFQPMPCQHCENAPCEVVCPVVATTHSPDGLNEMTYNRCVGTRYCSNNCPFKVRRFNFLDFWGNQYHGDTPPVAAMGHNPDVTVRMRGVMEKCTYCVQRIRRGQQEAKVAGRTLAANEVRTACQQACPTDAIIFGDINKPESLVALAKANERNYRLLDEINVQARTSYLAKIRNPNPDLKA